jgi:Thioredoxin like C-terminal domain
LRGWPPVPIPLGDLRSPEMYLGHRCSGRFASPELTAPHEPSAYTLPERLCLNDWALAGEWPVGREDVRLDGAVGTIANGRCGKAATIEP